MLEVALDWHAPKDRFRWPTCTRGRMRAGGASLFRIIAAVLILVAAPVAAVHAVARNGRLLAVATALSNPLALHVAAGRQKPAEERLRSKREGKEARQQSADSAEVQRRLDERTREEKKSQTRRRHAETKLNEAHAEIDEMKRRKTKKRKSRRKSLTFRLMERNPSKFQRSKLAVKLAKVLNTLPDALIPEIALRALKRCEQLKAESAAPAVKAAKDEVQRLRAELRQAKKNCASGKDQSPGGSRLLRIVETLKSKLKDAMARALGGTGPELRKEIHKSSYFKAALKDIHDRRDGEIWKYLNTHVYRDDVFAILRHMIKLSQNESNLITQTFKWQKLKDGRRVRWKLCEDSAFPAPLIFALNEMLAAENDALDCTSIEFSVLEDGLGADITGSPFGVDTAIANQLDSASKTRVGGMATAGTIADPHLINLTGDGAGLSQRFAGVRVSSVLGSTNMLNQSPLDVCNWLVYKAESKAESWEELSTRLKRITPDLGRLYNGGQPGELKPGGTASGVFIKFVLVADKPFMRHVCGCASHNHNSFGAPFCNCEDKAAAHDDGCGLYNLSHDPATHYNGSITPEVLAARAHLPLWYVLGMDEPDQWRVQCDKCGTVRHLLENNARRHTLYARIPLPPTPAPRRGTCLAHDCHARTLSITPHCVRCSRR